MTHAELIQANRERQGMTGPDPITEKVSADGSRVRVTVDGERVPPYADAVAYVKRVDTETYGIEYVDGYVDWLGAAHVAFGDYESIETI